LPSRGKELSACPLFPSALPSRRLFLSLHSCVASLKRPSRRKILLTSFSNAMVFAY
jgi:hypothetical protein